MTDHNDEVIRALAICDKINLKYRLSAGREFSKNIAFIRDLIRRQSVEIKSLPAFAELAKMADTAKIAHNVAIKEFAERLKEEMNNLSRMEYHGEPYFLVSKSFIDKLVEELTRRCPECKHFVGCETACGGVPCKLYVEVKQNEKS